AREEARPPYPPLPAVAKLLRNKTEQAGKVQIPAVDRAGRERCADDGLPFIRIDVLPEESDLPHARILELRDFGENRAGPPRLLAAAYVRHYAVRAEVVAAMHDGNEGAERTRLVVRTREDESGALVDVQGRPP